MKKFELFTVPQQDRVKALELHGIAWLDKLAEGERLVIGVPEVLGTWHNCIPLVLNPGMQDPFVAWVRENAQHVEGPVYNLPPLTAPFLCMVVDEDFDPRIQSPPDDTSEELLGVLAALGTFMTQCEAAAA